jgi:hypothetical protein
MPDWSLEADEHTNNKMAHTELRHLQNFTSKKGDSPLGDPGRETKFPFTFSRPSRSPTFYMKLLEFPD